jgi:hypothetical protein
LFHATQWPAFVTQSCAGAAWLVASHAAARTSSKKTATPMQHALVRGADER